MSLVFLNNMIDGFLSVFFIMYDLLWKEIQIKYLINDFNEIFTSISHYFT